MEDSDWPAAQAYLNYLADDAVDQLFSHYGLYGLTAIMLGATGTCSADVDEGQARPEEEVPAG